MSSANASESNGRCRGVDGSRAPDSDAAPRPLCPRQYTSLICTRCIAATSLLHVLLVGQLVSVFVHVAAMNLSLYTISAFIIIDTDGHRVLAKYYHPAGDPNASSKKLTTFKEQRTFEKGLFQKTKKAGGALVIGLL